MNNLSFQCVEKSKITIKVQLIMYAYMLFCGTIALLFQGRTLVGGLQTFSVLISLILSFIIYRRDNSNEFCMKCLLTSYTVVYIVFLMTSMANSVYAYILPNMMLAILFMNHSYIKFENITIFVLNLIDIAIKISTTSMSGDFIQSLITRFLILGICTYASTAICKKLKLFQEQNIASIEEKAAQQQESMDKELKMVEEINKCVVDSKDKLSNLHQAVETNYTSVTEIAQNCELTAEAIQKQTEMTYDIEKNIKDASINVKEVLENSDKGQSMIQKGIQLIDDLKIHATTVQETSDSTKVAVSNLFEQINKVRNIIASILNISNQTNLLALNASIEAARAGEAGKGFAVVADEIRELSDETKNATNEITEIINTLIEDAQFANESMDKSVDSVKKQNTLMEVVGGEFVSIGSTMQALHTSISRMDEVFKTIVESTTQITENISHLSATTEEVAASSQNGIQNGEDARKTLTEMTDIISTIYNVASKLATE